MASHTTIASGVLSVACLAAAVKCHLDCKRALEEGDEPPKSKTRMKHALVVGTVLFACVFAYQIMNKRSAASSCLPMNASSSYLPTSSMSHSQSEADFARRVSEATKKLRRQIRAQGPRTPMAPPPRAPMAHPPLMTPSMPSPIPEIEGAPSPSELAAKASAEISSFIASNM